MSILDDDNILFGEYDAKIAIEQWIMSNYRLYGCLQIDDNCGVSVLASKGWGGSIYTKNPQLTSLTNNGMFHFVKVVDIFGVVDCEVLTDVSDIPIDTDIIYIKNSPLISKKNFSDEAHVIIEN